MKRNLNSRALVLCLTAIFAVSPLTANESSFLVRNKKTILVGTGLVVATAVSIYYFRDNLLEIARKFLAEKIKNEAGTGRSLESFKAYENDYDNAYHNHTSKVEDPKVQDPKVQDPKVQDPKVEDPKVEDPKVEQK